MSDPDGEGLATGRGRPDTVARPHRDLTGFRAVRLWPA